MHGIRDRTTAPLALLAIALATAMAGSLACQPEQSAEPEPPPRIENPARNLAFARVADGFEVENNDEQSLSFRPTSGEGEQEPGGRVWIEVGPEDAGSINLVALVNSQRQVFEALDGGEFFGSRELRTPGGQPAYYSRGRFDDESGRVEEVRVFQLHPSQYRQLVAYYRYPAAEDVDSASRLQALFALLAEMEGLGDDETDAEGAAADEREADEARSRGWDAQADHPAA